jgi:hypothetical protein
MRKIVEKQMQLGEADIANIKFDLKSRDEIPKLLKGLQHIYCSPGVRGKVFEILGKIAPEGKSRNNGRPGMSQWKILVLGTLRLNCNWDYDKLREIANEHRTLRMMLQHPEEDEYMYPLQTLRDNVSLLTPELLEKINDIVVEEGHSLTGKKKEALMGRCDSWVVETDVHFPTDISLLFDAMRKVIQLISKIDGVAGWRQGKHLIRRLKKLMRRVQKMKRSSSKNPRKKAAHEEKIRDAYKAYIDEAQSLLEKAQGSLDAIVPGLARADTESLLAIHQFMGHALRQIDQTRRRALQGETIPHSEKVFSVFEDYTEWISKGKAGVRQELGLRVCLLEDQHGFILGHKVMRQQTDEKVAVEMAAEAKEKFPALGGCSYDKGFYTPGNKEELSRILDKVVMPKKGRLTMSEKEEESAEEFIRARHKHSAVESAISAMENHGLDRCLDVGLEAFERYVALAVVARNLQQLGAIIIEKERKRKTRREKYNRTRAARQQLSA